MSAALVRFDHAAAATAAAACRSAARQIRQAAGDRAAAAQRAMVDFTGPHRDAFERDLSRIQQRAEWLAAGLLSRAAAIEQAAATARRLQASIDALAGRR